VIALTLGAALLLTVLVHGILTIREQRLADRALARAFDAGDLIGDEDVPDPLPADPLPEQGERLDRAIDTLTRAAATTPHPHARDLFTLKATEAEHERARLTRAAANARLTRIY
jgi:hypothetical protein